MRFSPSPATLLLLPLVACGYHVSGNGEKIPKSVQTIAIPAFKNLTVRYRLTDYLPQAISREFIARTRYAVVPDPDKADAILKGAVVNYVSFPVINDQATGLATVVQMNVTLQMSLTDRRTHEIIWSNPSFEYRQRYEISLDQTAYFEESNEGLHRLSNDVARDVVSAILENF